MGVDDNRLVFLDLTPRHIPLIDRLPKIDQELTLWHAWRMRWSAEDRVLRSIDSSQYSAGTYAHSRSQRNRTNIARRVTLKCVSFAAAPSFSLHESVILTMLRGR